MRQLFRNGQATTLFFNDFTSMEGIVNWVKANVRDNSNLFNLNEAHSCSVCEGSGEVKSIIISGDEDEVELILETIIPVALFEDVIFECGYPKMDIPRHRFRKPTKKVVPSGKSFLVIPSDKSFLDICHESIADSEDDFITAITKGIAKKINNLDK